MQSMLIRRPNDIILSEGEIPKPGPGEVLIKVMASGVCGTDVHIFKGEYLGAYPVVPGHEFSGEVVETGREVQRIKPGERVAVEPNIACDNCPQCLNNRQNFCENWQALGVTLPGGMAQYVVAPQKAVFSIGDLPYDAGAFVEPLSCVVHGVERAQIRPGDRVAVLGAGPIGCLLLQMSRIQGASHVTMLEINPGRAELARSLGAERVVERLEELEPDAYDLVIDATGALPVMNRTLNFARKGGTVLLFGVPPAGARLEVEAFKIFQKGLKILSSYTSVRNSLQAVRLLKSGQIRVDELISHRLPLGELPAALALIAARDPGVRKVIILPNGPP